MRIVTWNMQAAFGSTSQQREQAWHYLASLGPDIALVQEALPPVWAGDVWDINHVQTYPAQDWGSAVLIRKSAGVTVWEGLSDGYRWLGRFPGSSVAISKVTLASRSIVVASIYASAKELTSAQVAAIEQEEPELDSFRYGGVKGIWPLYMIFDDLISLSQHQDVVLGGDFNAARSMDDIAHFASGSRQFFQHIEAAGFLNCLAGHIDGEEVRTYFKPGKGPYQLDHLHASPSMFRVLKDCRVIEHPAVDLALSDHALIMADFDL